MSGNPLLVSLRAAVDAAPDDVALRVHFAQLLAASGEPAEAVRQAAGALQRDPANQAALRLIGAASNGTADAPPPPQPASAPNGRANGQAPEHSRPAPAQDQPADETRRDHEDILRGLEDQFSDVVPPMFADDGGENGASHEGAYSVERAGIRLADVGGMLEVKARLEAAFLAPLRNPELQRLYGKSLRGGLLLYGPPGCGKTFIARALAGELDAAFVAVSLADVLDMYIGQSEKNLRELFEIARRNTPCVLFLDEFDALGMKRTQVRGGAGRGLVNQLLNEMDGVGTNNEGVFVLAATNHPWDVDVALRRPGRFDRMLLVLPPDEPAREAILRHHLRERPIANVDAGRLARATDGFSGADLAYVCETAAERALLDSARTGTARMIDMRDLEQALGEVKSSIGPWFDTARNVAQFANEGGVYDDLLAYLRKRRLV